MTPPPDRPARRHIWTGTLVLPDGTEAEVLLNVYPGAVIDLALRYDSADTWGPPTDLTYQGIDES